MKKESTDSQLLTSYQLELHTLGYVKFTVFTKIRNLINFKDFIGKEYRTITETDLHFFSIHLQNKQLHSNTIQHYYNSIEQFFVYLQREDVIKKNPCNFYDLQLIKQPKKTREILSQYQVKQLYNVAEKGKETIVLHLCYGCGLRAKELERINIEDLLLSRQLLKVVKGKNNQHRTIPISAIMIKDISNYLQYRNQQEVATNALLLNKKGKRLKAYTARTVLQKIVQRTTITKVITLHSLRHSIATHLLENGMKVAYVQQFLGHRQLETTEIYTRISKYQLKQLE